MIEHFAQLGEDIKIDPNCTIGYMYSEDIEPTQIGHHSRIRQGTIIYADCIIGTHFQTGHNAMIREKTTIGNHVVVGTNTIIDGNVIVGNYVKIESNCYIPTHVYIGERVFLGPNVVLTNDRYPLKLRDEYKPEGPVLEDGVTLGAGVVVCPGITIGSDSFVAAGAVITKNIPPNSFVKGVPGKVYPMPEKLQERNIALSWRKHLVG